MKESIPAYLALVLASVLFWRIMCLEKDMAKLKLKTTRQSLSCVQRDESLLKLHRLLADAMGIEQPTH